MSDLFRIEADTFGDFKVPADSLFGAQTARAVQNFQFSDLRMPFEFISAVAIIKKVAALVNCKLGILDREMARAIVQAANEIAIGQHNKQFPIDVFQTGSGTSTNMNVNEVIQHLAQRLCSKSINANDHVNMGQSSNDVIPTAIHLSAALECRRVLIPGLSTLFKALSAKAASSKDIVKTGRTHLMDAMPLTMGQEISGWAAQIKNGIARIEQTLPRIYCIAQGGTAVGTGVNSHPDFANLFAEELERETGLPFKPSDSFFESLSTQDAVVELSGQLKVIAVGIMKISNDLRWMNSGPRAGLQEISLVGLQPGSSMMPGKINPVIPEATAMIAAQVIGNDVTITIAGQSGNFQLNVMLPLIAYNILQSIRLLGTGCTALAEKAVSSFTINEANISRSLLYNPILLTRLTPKIGYERASKIAKAAYLDDRPLLDIALEMTDLGEDTLRDLLNPKNLTSNIDSVSSMNYCAFPQSAQEGPKSVVPRS